MNEKEVINHMVIHAVESDLLDLESKKLINGGKRIANAKVVPKRTPSELRKK